MSNDFQNLIVSKKQLLTPDVVQFDLVNPSGSPLPSFTPGAHITVKAPNGMSRSYSLCGLPQDTRQWQIAVKREKSGRGGSLSMFEDLKLGDSLEVRPWLNLFELKEDAKSYLFIAGGIGITPILSMMRHLLSKGKQNFELYYLTRDALNTPFLELLSQPEWADRIHIHHDNADPSLSLDLWPLLETPNGAEIYCCGPQVLMESVKDMSGHWPSECVHFESFGAASTENSLNTPFDVILNSNGQKVHVPAELSLLEALKAQGLSVPSSCESGTCGSCRTGLISGEADHRDFVLMDDERESCLMVCVSRARSPQLVLDL